MEKAVMRRPTEDAEAVHSREFPIMRTLARFHECDVETLYSRIDASEVDVHEILAEMVSKEEVEAAPGTNRRFALTLKGWGEYLKLLGSIYELPE